MKTVLFYHSLISDWNHGNAHFLRGICSELLDAGHQVGVFEPEDGWSLRNLRAEHGDAPAQAFRAAYPRLASAFYNLRDLDLDRALDGADLVLVHEWNPHELVRRIGEHSSRSRDYRLLFHDTHHRSVTERGGVAGYDLRHYDGVLAFGNVIRDLYLSQGWAQRAWTWHEAADTRVFRPLPYEKKEGDLIWIGNWGDGERTRELHEFLLEPVRDLGLRCRIHGVRYPAEALDALSRARIEYSGWLPNQEVPRAFARHRVTVHVPRRPYARALPGIPTIRVFEALACGIPLASAPWDDSEGLFEPGADYLIAHDGPEMTRVLRSLLCDGERARELAAHGLNTVVERHTCAHRVRQLLDILAELNGGRAQERGTA